VIYILNEFQHIKSSGAPLSHSPATFKLVLMFVALAYTNYRKPDISPPCCISKSL
jgi:hypothetical protein